MQTRYYDPAIGRFINADTFVSTGQGQLGNNMFAYCRNNPVSRIDISGECDLECNDIDPLNGELVHEDGGVSGTNNAASTGSKSSVYTAPSGGGGITNTVQIGDVSVEFGHGGRHLNGTEFTPKQVESIIAQDVVDANLSLETYYPGRVHIGSAMVRYSGFRLSENRINIGTYYLEHS